MAVSSLSPVKTPLSLAAWPGYTSCESEPGSVSTLSSPSLIRFHAPVGEWTTVGRRNLWTFPRCSSASWIFIADACATDVSSRAITHVPRRAHMNLTLYMLWQNSVIFGFCSQLVLSSFNVIGHSEFPIPSLGHRTSRTSVKYTSVSVSASLALHSCKDFADVWCLCCYWSYSSIF